MNAELDPTERDALRAYAEAEVSEDFADRVVIAWQHESEPELGARASTHALGRAHGNGPGRRLVAAASAMLAVAAALTLVHCVQQGTREITQPGPRIVLPTEPSAEAQDADPELALVREEAFAVLMEHCNPCHDGEATDGKPGALAVFDLRSPAWWATASDTQLPIMLDRVQDKGTAEQAAAVDRFVMAELHQRGSGG